MTKPLTAHCDKCGLITDVIFKQSKHPNGIQETYFKCEHCHYRYTSFVTDKKVRKMQQKKEAMKDKHLWEKRLELQEQINTRMSKLKYNLINYGKADL